MGGGCWAPPMTLLAVEEARPFITATISPILRNVNHSHSLIENVTGALTVHSDRNVTEGPMATSDEMTIDERRKYLATMA
jgi:hypothetical protein